MTNPDDGKFLNPNQRLRELLQRNSNSENEYAHRVTSEAIQTIIKRVVALEEKVDALSKWLDTIHTALVYKPEGSEKHLNMVENYDEIYSRIRKLEHGGRL